MTLISSFQRLSHKASEAANTYGKARQSGSSIASAAFQVGSGMAHAQFLSKGARPRVADAFNPNKMLQSQQKDADLNAQLGMDESAASMGNTLAVGANGANMAAAAARMKNLIDLNGATMDALKGGGKSVKEEVA